MLIYHQFYISKSQQIHSLINLGSLPCSDGTASPKCQKKQTCFDPSQKSHKERIVLNSILGIAYLWSQYKGLPGVTIPLIETRRRAPSDDWRGWAAIYGQGWSLTNIALDQTEDQDVTTSFTVSVEFTTDFLLSLHVALSRCHSRLATYPMKYLHLNQFTVHKWNVFYSSVRSHASPTRRIPDDSFPFNRTTCQSDCAPVKTPRHLSKYLLIASLITCY